MNLEGPALDLVLACPVGHLATANRQGTPHVVPVCFAYDRGRFYFVVDLKPKRNPERIKRLRNIQENPRVALVIDRYDTDWSHLAFVLVHGIAQVIREAEEWQHAIDLLRARYPNYQSMPLSFTANPAVRIEVERWHFWRASESQGSHPKD
ncbi:MAG: TIGR03668 family PPOX class F420-dependent oxidoreductase [Candidatus Binatia bacterium]|nr:TIGR03668 family PPOX class F420-dependent oxidoreductase [Candidatus Binatia bacterium]